MAAVVHDQLTEADLVIAGSVQNTENTDNNVEFGAVATVGGCLSQMPPKSDTLVPRGLNRVTGVGGVALVR